MKTDPALRPEAAFPPPAWVCENIQPMTARFFSPAMTLRKIGKSGTPFQRAA